MGILIKKLIVFLITLTIIIPINIKDDDGSITIVWISDTQNISRYDYPGAFEAMGDWIVENKNDIAYIVQTGDAVDNGYLPWQWDNYRKLYNKFSNDIPYIAIAGNHELGTRRMQWRAYLALPEVQSIPEDHKYAGGKALYTTFTYGSEKFIIAGIGYGAIEECTDWINSVLKEHSDHTAILLFHCYLKSAKEYLPQGKLIFETIVKANSNVRIVLCGHINKGGNAFRQEQIDDNGDGVIDRTVTAMMYDYQAWGKNCGQLRTLTFYPSTRDIIAHTFSPYTGNEFEDVAFGTAIFTIQDAF